MEENFKNTEINNVYRGAPQRIDIYLKVLFPDFSRQLIKKIIEDGMVVVNGKKVKPSYRLKENDSIVVSMGKNESDSFSLNLDDITIYEDKDIIVVNKPAGVLTHPTGESWLNDLSALNLSKNTLVWLVYSSGKIEPDVRRAGLVHRLDAQTSGVMVIARNLRSQSFLMEQFSSRSVEKNYKAVVSGIINDDRIIIEAPIGRFRGDKKLRVMEYGRDALTEVAVIERGRVNSYIDVFPKTGRTNQIRVHLSYISHPIIGDDIYGNHFYKRLMLHSYSISFLHPSKNKKLKFTAELGDDFKKSVKELLS